MSNKVPFLQGKVWEHWNTVVSHWSPKLICISHQQGRKLRKSQTAFLILFKWWFLYLKHYLGYLREFFCCCCPSALSFMIFCLKKTQELLSSACFAFKHENSQGKAWASSSEKYQRNSSESFCLFSFDIDSQTESACKTPNYGVRVNSRGYPCLDWLWIYRAKQVLSFISTCIGFSWHSYQKTLKNFLILFFIVTPKLRFYLSGYILEKVFMAEP